MANADKVLVEFNIKNAAYALKKGDTYDAPVKLGYSDSISLEADYSEKVIYGDGRKVATIPNDRGKTGTLTLLAIDLAYEIAMGRRMKTVSGYAEIKQNLSKEHALYFETEYIDENTGATKTAKTWLYGVTSGRPSETKNQTTDDINNNNTEYSLTIKGTPMMNSTGNTVFKDANGNVVYAWQETSLPGDTGYETFGDTCTPPKAPADAVLTGLTTGAPVAETARTYLGGSRL